MTSRKYPNGTETELIHLPPEERAKGYKCQSCKKPVGAVAEENVSGELFHPSGCARDYDDGEPERQFERATRYRY